MTLADQLEDTFPHGTAQGYNLGCTGNICHAAISCSEVRLRYISDWGYRKKIDSGLSAVEIAEVEKAEALALKQAAKPVELVPKPKAKRPKAQGAAKTPWKPSVIPPEAHGTVTGYRYGCRLADDCPGLQSAGTSCTQANRTEGRKRAAKAIPADTVVQGAEPGVALSMLNAGTSRVKISAALGISYKTVIRALKRDAALLALA